MMPCLSGQGKLAYAMVYGALLYKCVIGSNYVMVEMNAVRLSLDIGLMDASRIMQFISCKT